MSLTRKQSELLAYITDRLLIDNVSPSFGEMAKAVGLKSKSGVHRLINALEERGFIRRLHYRARALEVLRQPQTFLDSVPTHELRAELERREARRPVLSIGA